MNNTSFSRIIGEATELKILSCVKFQGSQLEIDNNYFSNNTGSVGGALYIAGFSLEVTIQNTIFVGNFADVGGAIAFPQDINGLNYTMNNCYFNKNIATGNANKFEKKRNYN